MLSIIGRLLINKGCTRNKTPRDFLLPGIFHVIIFQVSLVANNGHLIVFTCLHLLTTLQFPKYSPSRDPNYSSSRDPENRHKPGNTNQNMSSFDPFETRIQFINLLRKLNASQQSIQKVTSFAINYGARCGEDLWECVIEQCNKVSSIMSTVSIIIPFNPLYPSSLPSFFNETHCNSSRRTDKP